MSARAAAAALMLAIGAAAAAPCEAKVLMTQEEALEIAFPGPGEVKRDTAYLTDAQAAEVEKLSGEPLPTRVIARYSGSAASGSNATAYFDSHIVRTRAETLMIVVAADGTISRVDVLSFDEPRDYLPRPGWAGQLSGKPLDEELSIRRGIRPISGATLTARAIVAAARRTLALHRVLGPPAGAPGGGAP